MLIFFATLDQNVSTNWIREASLSAKNVNGIYLTGIEWAMQTVTTVGYGTLTTTNWSEKLYAIFGMLVGAGVFAYVPLTRACMHHCFWTLPAMHLLMGSHPI